MVSPVSVMPFASFWSLFVCFQLLAAIDLQGICWNLEKKIHKSDRLIRVKNVIGSFSYSISAAGFKTNIFSMSHNVLDKTFCHPAEFVTLPKSKGLIFLPLASLLINSQLSSFID